MKFVNDKQPRDYAELLAKKMSELEKLRAREKELSKEVDQLKAFVFKVNKGKSWEFNGALYRRMVKITTSQRLILDQDECKRLLKKKTPYKPVDVTTIKVDYVYQD